MSQLYVSLRPYTTVIGK